MGIKEKSLELLWGAIGGSVAIALALWFVDGQSAPFLLASLGGSTVFLYALTEAEAAQPRALFGGHLSGALIGILCYAMFGDSLWVSVLAVVLAMTFMKAARMIHPPAGANPLIMVNDHAGPMALLDPVGLGVGTLFVIAMLWSRIRPGRAYPCRWW